MSNIAMFHLVAAAAFVGCLAAFAVLTIVRRTEEREKQGERPIVLPLAAAAIMGVFLWSIVNAGLI